MDLSMNTIMQNHASGPLRLLNTHTSTTDGKKAKQALKKSEERSRLALEASDISLWELDLIVTQNSGYIDVYSDQNQGSVFKIYLPSAMKDPTTQLPLAGN